MISPASFTLSAPARLPIGARVVRQTRQARSIGVDDVDLVVAIPEGGEGDPVAVRGPAGTKIIAPVGDARNAFSINIHDKDIMVTLRSTVEGKLCAIRRPGAAPPHVVQIGDLRDLRSVLVHDV